MTKHDPSRVRSLEQWNQSWSHPEIGDFYTWDTEEGAWVETSTIRKCRMCGVILRDMGGRLTCQGCYYRPPTGRMVEQCPMGMCANPVQLVYKGNKMCYSCWKEVRA